MSHDYHRPLSGLKPPPKGHLATVISPQRVRVHVRRPLIILPQDLMFQFTLQLGLRFVDDGRILVLSTIESHVVVCRRGAPPVAWPVVHRLHDLRVDRHIAIIV